MGISLNLPQELDGIPILYKNYRWLCGPKWAKKCGLPACAFFKACAEWQHFIELSEWGDKHNYCISNNWFTNSRVPEVGPISKLRKHIHILGFPEMGGYPISSSIYKSIFHEINHLFWGTPNSNLTSSALSCGKARLSWWKDLGSSTFSSTLAPIWFYIYTNIHTYIYIHIHVHIHIHIHILGIWIQNDTTIVLSSSILIST